MLLLDLWGKLDGPGAVFADITWVGYTGREAPARIGKAFNAVKRARDAAVELVQQRTRAGEEIRGFVPQAAVGVIAVRVLQPLDRVDVLDALVALLERRD